jgi:hypothetical protein
MTHSMAHLMAYDCEIVVVGVHDTVKRGLAVHCELTDRRGSAKPLSTLVHLSVFCCATAPCDPQFKVVPYWFLYES